MIWLMCWTRWGMLDGKFDDVGSGAPVMVNSAQIISISPCPFGDSTLNGVSAVRTRYAAEFYLPGTPEQVVRAISTWLVGRGAHIDMRSELAP